LAFDPSLTYELVLPSSVWTPLEAHLFRDDHDEHGAVIAAGVARVGDRVRLLGRHVFLAEDGVSYVPGKRGYRMLTAEFVRDQALFCRDEKLAYLAIHNHFGADSVSFSSDDLQSHERGYPALRDVTRGQIVGAVVFAKNAAAGDLWLDSGRAPLKVVRALGANIVETYPRVPARPNGAGVEFDRQARLFGDRGQALLARQRVGIIGLGGVGSLVAEYLSRLGVGVLVLVDPDRLEPSNLPRVVGSSRRDAMLPLTGPGAPAGVRKRAARVAKLKVDIANREARRSRCDIEIVRHPKSVTGDDVARDLAACDYLFLAADSMQARLVFNALVHQFLIPGTQLGAKVPVDLKTGEVGRVFSVVRPIMPGETCLSCNGLISASKLQEEALTPEERRAQRYVDEPDIPAPSVITLNAVAAAHGVNDYLFRLTGLRDARLKEEFVYYEPRTGSSRIEEPRRDHDCLECGEIAASRFARGDLASLPTEEPPRKGRRRTARSRS
jgi:molybdopterin/thiamine biosynthesis adenylyltransferase